LTTETVIFVSSGIKYHVVRRKSIVVSEEYIASILMAEV
jgi:hypothetical protein